MVFTLTRSTETRVEHYFINYQHGDTICLYCDRCANPACCVQSDECPQTILREINRAIARAKEIYSDRTPNAPHR